MPHRKTKFSIFFLIAAILTVAALFYIKRHYQIIIDSEPLLSHSHQATNVAQPAVTQIGKDATTTPAVPPDHLLLPIPFTPQAPTANWDTLHGEACEEASAIMANAYFSGMTDVTLKPEFVENEITKITQWEQDHFGYYLDVNSEEAAQMISGVYGLQTKILRDFKEADIKSELAQNHIVLSSTNGKLLGNPNFRSPGPPYHMLVIKGYDGDTIITNDPGTRKGLNYAYSFSTLYKANGNFNHKTHEVDTTQKNIIVVWK